MIFGYSLSLSSNGSKLIGCSPLDDVSTDGNQGSCHVFQYQEGNQSYSYQQQLIASDGMMDDQFGYDSSISDDESMIIIGTENAEQVYVYEYQLGNDSYQEIQILNEGSTSNIMVNP